MLFDKFFYIAISIFFLSLTIYIFTGNELSKRISIKRVKAIYLAFNFFILFINFSKFSQLNEVLQNPEIIQNFLILIIGFISISKKHNRKISFYYSLLISIYFACKSLSSNVMIDSLFLTFLMFLSIKNTTDENHIKFSPIYLLFFTPVLLINLGHTHYIPYSLIIIKMLKKNILRQDYFLFTSLFILVKNFDSIKFDSETFFQIMLVVHLFAFFIKKHHHNYVKFEEGLLYNAIYFSIQKISSVESSIFLLTIYLINKFSIKFSNYKKRRIQNMLTLANVSIQIYLLKIAIQSNHYYYIIMSILILKNLIITNHGKQIIES